MANWFWNFAKAQRKAREADANAKDDGSEDEEPQPPGKHCYCKTYKARDAVMVLYQAKIKAILDVRNAGHSGSKQYMGMYPAALSEVMKSLTDEELKAAEDTASRWNKDGTPAELQQKYIPAYLIWLTYC